ncbi:ribbon-helix-helix protein, CopG family [Litoreibacter halocynthiae]|uniref:ribbon-helix-helix protein, CopG family n=1 Tax=Litoreibacter halocynthiae TaxID=1242689 RepID=UPI003D7E2812
MTKTTTRVQIELPSASMERLKALRDKSEAASYAEVVRNALRLYENLIHECESGAELYLKNKEGSETTIKLVF